MRQGVKTARGRYREVSTSTKRDWHRLLDYNRHDCVGLRHLVLRATAEAEKRRAYMNTVYSVRDGRRTIRFRIGSRKRAIEALLTCLGAREWAHMTAWNPGLTRLSTQGNHQRQAALARTTSDRGFLLVPGAGEDPSGAWPPEDSAFVVGIPAAEARELARMFSQWAIVIGEVGEKSRLLWCLEPGPDTNVIARLPLTVHEPNVPR